ncbi:SRPBCC family protein [Hymenobacter sp. BT664]|uniref:SRPBCC family protein n=1 Tax=Hymenobacter montanus TaxID=2771359 RepID=A0A927GJF9_9BACT|nr:SRPBCC family protein [Hymenobacter montanus]MBD2768370.1 SRPBCC family protein [Hymenobacter montanus]
MWTKSHSIVTKDVTKEQMWALFADVNNWHTWDKGIEFAKLEGRFDSGNRITLRPNGGPTLKVDLIELIENKRFLVLTHFPFAKMYVEHRFEEVLEGLKITNSVSVKGLLGFIWVKLVAAKIAEALPQDTEQQIKGASRL